MFLRIIDRDIYQLRNWYKTLSDYIEDVVFVYPRTIQSQSVGEVGKFFGKSTVT